jgi:MFS family permease
MSGYPWICVTKHERSLITEPAYPSRSQANYLLIILMLGCFLSFTDRFVLTVLMPAIQDDLHISDTQLSLLQGVSFSLFFSVTAIPFGWMADRVNRRNLAAAGIAAWCLATAASGFTRSYPMLLVARSVVGIGEATLMPTAFSMLADSFPFERRGRAFGMYTSAAAVGTGGALVLGGIVMRALRGVHSIDLGGLGTFAPWQIAFMVVGAPGLIVAALLLTVREPARRGRHGGAAGVAEIRSLFTYIRANGLLFLCVLAAYSSYTSVCYATVSWAPTLLVRKFHFPLSSGGFAVGIAALTTGVFGTLLGGWLCDRWTVNGAPGGKFRLPYLWSMMIFPVVIGFALSPIAAVSIGFFAIFIMLQNAVYASGGAVMQDIVPSNLSGRATALWYVVTGLVGQVTGPTFAALLNDYLFHDRAALPYSIVLVAIPGVIATFIFARAGRAAVDRTRALLR